MCGLLVMPWKRCFRPRHCEGETEGDFDLELIERLAMEKP